MAEKREERLKEISEKLEQGVKELFTSERYAEYLATMSKFHNYSFRNTLLIAMQKPEATLVAGYQAWQKKFHRQVKKGEKGIQIIAPVPVRHKEEVEKVDPETQEPILKDNGQPETEEIETVIPRFRLTTVFDVGQTYGEPLPELGNGDLTANVEDYEIFMEALRRVSPVPMRFAEMEGTSHGYYHNADKEIVIKEGMSESQTMKTAVHEISHAKLHDREIMEEQGIEKDKETKEVEAESIAFMVCQSFGLDTSDYSFPYIAGWSSGRDMKELRSSMDTIRKTAGELMDSIGDELKELQKERVKEIRRDDLILKITFDENNQTYHLVRNMGKAELLEQLAVYYGFHPEDRNGLVDFLIDSGADPTPLPSPGEENVSLPVTFYDVEYDYRSGVHDAAELPAMGFAEMQIARAEYGKTLFDEEERNLIVNYAYKLDDKESVRKLVDHLADAIEAADREERAGITRTAQAEIDALPDSMVGLSEMHGFGYSDDSMLPLTAARAEELYGQKLRIYCLYPDGTEALAEDAAIFRSFEGMFGIEKEAWESVRENTHAVNENSTGVEIEQHEGTWRSVESRKINGQEFFRMEHEGFGGTAAGVIVDANGNLAAQELENGFDAGAYQAIREYFAERGIPVYDRRLIAEDVRQEEKTMAAEEMLADTEPETRPETKGKAQKTYLPVYSHLLSYARDHGEVDTYLDSRKLNIDCKKAIEDALRENYDGRHLKHGVAAPILEEFGAERVSFILANTMNYQNYDGRYSRTNREWAEGIPVFRNQEKGYDLNRDYLLTSHPALLDGFINLTRQEIREQEQAKEQEAEKPFIGRYYVADDLRKGVMDIRFYSDLDEALSDYFSVSNQNLKAFGVENTERLTGSLDLLQCKNGLDGIVQDYKKVKGWDRPEIRELVDRLEKNIDGRDAAVAYELPDGFMTIQTSEEGYDYSFYDKSYREMDGGIYDNPHAAIQEAVEDVLGEQGLSLEDCMAVDFDELSDKTEAAEQEYLEKRKEIFTDSLDDKEAVDRGGEMPDAVEKKQQLTPTSGHTEPEKSLNGLSRAEIEEMALCMAQAEIDDMGLSEDVKLNGARVYGSRTRDGLYKAGSDVDVVLSYTGGIAEDYFFNVLHEGGMKMAGIPLDINPIDTEKTGTMEEYLAKAEQYLDEKEATRAAEKAEEKAEDKAAPASEEILTFFTAEDREFHVFGVYEEGLSLPEAVNLYNQLDPEFCRGIPSIGFHYHNSSSIYDGTEQDIYSGGEVLWKDVSDIEEYRNSRLVQDTLKELQEMAERGEVRGYRGQNTDAERIQSASQKSEECKAGGKKESVLQALRQRQAKLKAQENAKTAEKSQNHKKGDMEL